MGHRFAPVVLVRNGKNFLNCRRYEQTKQDAGIIDHWDLWFRPMPIKCMGSIQSGRNRQDVKP